VHLRRLENEQRCRASQPGSLKRVEMTAALGSGSAPLPSLPQPRPRAPRLILGNGPCRFEATSHPSGGSPKAADLLPNPLTGNRPKISCQPGHRLFASTTQLVAGIRHLSALLGGADVYVARAIVPLASKPKWPFAAEGAQLKASIPGLQSLTPLEMAQRLRDPSLRDNYLASLVEQEICSQASAFLG